MKERFLQVRATMEDEVDVIKRAIEDLTEHCESTETRITGSIKTTEALQSKCDKNLADAQEKQNDAAAEADATAKEHAEMHEDLDKTMKTCNANYLGYEGELCALRKIRGEVYKLKASGATPSMQDCQVSGWNPGPCSKECGGGTQTLTRTVLMPEKDGAKCLPLTAVRTCNWFPCPIDCQKEPWEKWSACSADCGGGVRSRVREVIIPAKYGGTSCGATEESEQCNAFACDQDCVMKEWTEWAECSKACDGGTTKRQRFVSSPATGTGKCADLWSPERLEYKVCNSEPCQLSTGMNTMKCKAKMDVVLLIDGSGSLGVTGWKAELKAADALLSAFEGAEDKIQVSVILYSGPSNWNGVYRCFGKSTGPNHLEDVCKTVIVEQMSADIAAVKKKVEKLKFPRGSTLTSIALMAAATTLNHGRQDAKSTVICITDGRPLSPWNTIRASREVRKKARLMWVPVTKYAPLALIKKMATRRWQENVVKVDSFGELQDNKYTITNHLIADLCPKADMLS